MEGAPGLEPGCTVTVETTVGGVRQEVVVRLFPLGQLLFELQQQQVMKSQVNARMREREALPWKITVCSIAATILLHAWSGTRARRRRVWEFQMPSSDYFAKLAQAKDSRLRQVAGSMGVDLVQLGKEADAVLARRREIVHLETLEDLEINVHNVRSWIDPYLEVLEEMCPWVGGEGGEEVLTLG